MKIHVTATPAKKKVAILREALLSKGSGRVRGVPNTRHHARHVLRMLCIGFDFSAKPESAKIVESAPPVLLPADD